MLSKIKKNKFFFIGAILSTVFIIFMILTEVISALNWTVVYENDKSIPIEKAKLPLNHVDWVTFFYFTFQSNLLVMIYLYLRTFEIVKPKENKNHKMFQLIVTINITITMVTYWTILTPFSSIWKHGGYVGALKIFNTFLVHLVTPIFMIVAFHLDKLKKDEEGVVIAYKNIWKVLIYPSVWLVISIIVYFVSRTDHLYGVKNLANGNYVMAENQGNIHHYLGVAVYFFLSFDTISIWITIGAIFAIGVSFLLFGMLFLMISNPHSKIHNLKLKK